MVRIACEIVAISLTLAATVGPRVAGAVCASGVSCPADGCCASSTAVCNVEFEDCCNSGKLCGKGTVCCTNATDTCCDVGGSSQCCAAGTSCTADGSCVPNTPTATPTVTPTLTPTSTPTATPTNTPVPQGGACSTPSQCGTGFCANGVCCNSACTDPLMRCNLAGQVGTCARAAASAPTLTPWGLFAASMLLAGIAGLALRRRMRGR